MPDQKQPSENVIHLNEGRETRGAEKATAALRAELNQTRTLGSVPQAELELLGNEALGDTGQSRSVRYLLFLLTGADDPTGFAGEGLLEMRPLDRKLADAFLKILEWWCGPTKSDQPLYDVLQMLEKQFSTSEPKR
jgi:hypothetical protein